MRKTLITGLTIIIAVSLGYLSGKMYYAKNCDQVVEALDLKSYTLWELEKQAAILKQIKEENYRKATETQRELKVKQHHFNKEFNEQIAGVKWTAWGIGAGMACFLLILSYVVNKLLTTKNN